VADYALIDAGDGARLERFGEHTVMRPHLAATERRRAPGRWDEADLRFDRHAGWRGAGLAAARHAWTVRIDDFALELRPTATGQVGLFPEHASLLPWLLDRVRERSEKPDVLNLFAYTGLATLALARVGASVAHVDAARPAVGWARRNAALNGLEDGPIRWLVDDARGFVAREIRRGRRYTGVVLDAPTYGHGTSGKAWRLDRDLPPLLDDVRRLVARDGFILLTAHQTNLVADRLGDYLGPQADTGDLALHALSGAAIRLGAFARVDRAS
jgi:23S rRNA (cytosine1962-C5)-methyltransferase